MPLLVIDIGRQCSKDRNKVLRLEISKPVQTRDDAVEHVGRIQEEVRGASPARNSDVDQAKQGRTVQITNKHLLKKCQVVQLPSHNERI
ncbi:hypothetical protein J6590_082630 [Homalodisca vitripennis]|nr:hypothetical protein J6590_082630 [Homalodisca vitripennis]